MEKLCENYTKSRRERNFELVENGFVGDNTLRYHGMGCYECIGLDFDCSYYVGLAREVGVKNEI